MHLQMYLDIKEVRLPDLLEKGEIMSHLKDERERKKIDAGETCRAIRCQPPDDIIL